MEQKLEEWLLWFSELLETVWRCIQIEWVGFLVAKGPKGEARRAEQNASASQKRRAFHLLPDAKNSWFLENRK